MLQSLRENLKGAVAVFVLLIFIVPLVLFGVEQLFVGSVGGNDAASVNGEGVSSRELQRAIAMDKDRMIRQFDLAPNDPRLDDSSLRAPALTKIVQRMALLQEAKNGSMGVGKDVLWAQIAEMEAFQVDGKFDKRMFAQRLAGNDYTPATFLDAIGKDYLLRQLTEGLSSTSFTTDADVELIARISKQKRSFFSVSIPKSVVEDNLEVTEEEVQAYYTDNSASYMEQETVSLNYIELSLDALAKKRAPTEEEIKEAYALEVSEFKPDPKYFVAHILVEKGDAADDKVAKVEARLDAGDDFKTIAKELSDDLGSKEAGGELGQLLEEAYPAEFVSAAKALEVGGVSKAVTTDSGIHFIKLLNITDTKPPAFEERKDAIAYQLARIAAQEDYVSGIASMDELTFGSDGLDAAAKALGLEVKSTEPFPRVGGTGIATNQEVVNAAFADDVLVEAQNSRVLELGGQKAVVIRLKNHKEAALKPLESVSDSIKTQLRAEKIDELLVAKADALKAKIVGIEQAKAEAEAAGYEYTLHKDTKRNDFEVEQAILRKAFSLGRPKSEADMVVDVVKTNSGYSVLGLYDVTDGGVTDLAEQELTGLKGQLSYQTGQLEMSAFETSVVSAAKVE